MTVDEGTFRGLIYDQLKSKEERLWMAQAETVIPAITAQAVRWSMYEPFKLKLGNTWYRPDFGHLLANGSLLLVETKGSPFQPNYRDSRTRINVAPAIFPFFDFWLACPRSEGKGGGWDILISKTGTHLEIDMFQHFLVTKGA